MSTSVGMGILLASGFWTAWRSGSFSAGAAAGLATTAFAAVLSTAGAAILLAVWHDSGTMTAIRGSGGLAEVFLLPTWLVVPGVVVGGIGGLLGAATRRMLRVS